MINISLHIWKLPPAKGGWVLWSELWSTQICSLHCGGGVLWSELWSTQIWSLHFGGYSDLNFGQLKSEVFILGRGGTLIWNSREGCSGEFGQKFTLQPETCLCITDSLSHTRYVETKTGPFIPFNLSLQTVSSNNFIKPFLESQKLKSDSDALVI